MQEIDENIVKNEKFMDFSYTFEAVIFVVVIVGLLIAAFN